MDRQTHLNPEPGFCPGSLTSAYMLHRLHKACICHSMFKNTFKNDSFQELHTYILLDLSIVVSLFDFTEVEKPDLLMISHG